MRRERRYLKGTEYKIGGDRCEGEIRRDGKENERGN